MKKIKKRLIHEISYFTHGGRVTYLSTLMGDSSDNISNVAFVCTTVLSPN